MPNLIHEFLKIKTLKHLGFITVLSLSSFTMAHAESFSDGLWASDNQQHLVSVESGEYDYFELSPVSCLHTDSGDLEDFENLFKEINPINSTTYATQSWGNVHQDVWLAQDDFPGLCTQGIHQASDDVLTNFDVFAHHIKHFYVGTLARHFDWNNWYINAQATLLEKPDDEMLWTVLTHFLDEMEDGHLEITHPEWGAYSAQSSRGFAHKLELEWHSLLQPSDLQSYQQSQFDLQLSAIQKTLDQPLEAVSGLPVYLGRTPEGFDYLLIEDFEFEGDVDDAQLYQQALGQSMDQLSQQLAQSTGLIVDLRFNGGGNDQTALDMARYFIAESQTVFQFRSKIGDHWTENQMIALSAANNTMIKPLVLITGSETSSAAEVFSLSLSTQNHVTILGEKTEGILSNAVERHLPNGWTFTIAPDQYRSLQGHWYESTGLPVDLHNHPYSRSSRQTGVDPNLIWAEKILKLDHAIESLRQEHDIPAISTALHLGDAGARARAFGLAHQQHNIPATADTLFGLGSVSKTLIGLAIAQLMAEQLFDLDTPINDVLPFQVDNPHIHHEVIRLRHLLTHTSGLTDGNQYYASYTTLNQPVDSLLNFLSSYYLPQGQRYVAEENFSTHAPGTHFQYSNVASALAALIVEHQTQTPFYEYVDTHILQAAGMSDTGYFRHEMPPSRLAIPYSPYTQNQALHFPTYPDGMLNSSAEDMLAYLKLLTDDKSSIMPDGLYSPFNTLYQTEDVHEGSFWQLSTSNTGLPQAQHTGSDPGIGAIVDVIPSIKASSFLAMNTDVVDQQGINASGEALFSIQNQQMALAEDMTLPAALVKHQSGSWYDPSHDGEGFKIEILNDHLAVVYWFSYDDQGHQLWLSGTGQIEHNRIDVTALYQLTGGQFGEAFDEDAIQYHYWGSLVITFSANAQGNLQGQVDYAARSPFNSASLTIVPLGESNNQPLHHHQYANGSWYEPSRSGEGFIFQLLEADLANLYWFTWTPEGEKAWVVGLGQFNGETWVFDDMRITEGGVFGQDFDPDRVNQQHWGQIEFTLSNCDQAEVDYDSLWGPGQLSVSRLTTLSGQNCEPF